MGQGGMGRRGGGKERRREKRWRDGEKKGELREEGKDMVRRGEKEKKERRENFDEYSHPSEHPSFSPHSRMPLASL